MYEYIIPILRISYVIFRNCIFINLLYYQIFFQIIVKILAENYRKGCKLRVLHKDISKNFKFSSRKFTQTRNLLKLKKTRNLAQNNIY